VIIILVKCKCHSVKIDRDIAFKVITNGKNNYYCSEQDYLYMKREKESREDSIIAIKLIIGETTNTALFKELKIVGDIHGYYKILAYLKENNDMLKKIMNKSFGNEFGKIKYFFTIVKNNIGDFKEQLKTTEIKEITENYSVNYKQKKKKKSLNEYLNEYLEEDK
jgi:hypothetical protein